MAALASLAPAHGGTIESVQHGAYGSNGSGRDLATSTPVAEIFSGPRWIAELVELGPEESKLALDLEMAHELAARATVEAASTSSIATVRRRGKRYFSQRGRTCGGDCGRSECSWRPIRIASPRIAGSRITNG